MHDAATFVFGWCYVAWSVLSALYFLEGVPQGVLLWRTFEIIPAGLLLPWNIPSAQMLGLHLDEFVSGTTVSPKRASLCVFPDCCIAVWVRVFS